VTSGGVCTLRAAIQQANALSACGAIAINFSGVSGTIDLGSVLPSINHNINLNGPGPDVLAVEPAANTGGFGVFWINPGFNVAMSGITIKNGFSQMGQGGGAIHNQASTLTLSNSVITGNRTFGSPGGGLYNDNGGNLSTGFMTIINCTISGNQTTGSGSLTPKSGGGVFNTGNSLTIINSTISGNKTGDLPGGSTHPDGGGIAVSSGTLALINNTITANQSGAGGRGGGVAGSPGTAVNMRNTIIANNSAADSSSGPDLFGTFNSQDYNLITNVTGATLQGPTTHNLINVNPLLGPLTFNGGSMTTHALLAGSPAINAGNNILAVDQNGSALTNDERGAGFPRIYNSTVDIGAYEAGNPIDEASFFVKQQYLDFLNRQPDQSGWDFWTNQITSCGSNAACIEARRVNTSGAFFLSIEFQQTGNLVYKMYKAGFGNLPGKPVAVDRAPFLSDTRQIQSTPVQVIVGQANWQAQLETNKQTFALAFVQRANFQTQHSSQSASDYVNDLFSKTGATPTAPETTAAVNAFNSAGGGDAGRAAALRSVAESASVAARLNNEAFVLMQYFGYLQRNPYDPPESTLDYSGYNFWLGKLNQFNGDFAAAEMVKAFIASTEYRQRFGP
jgi:hypothetical protein